MPSPQTQTDDDVFPHDEYHFYILDHNDEPRHIHLTETIVQECRDLIDTDYPVDGSDWTPKFWHHLEDGISFMFCPLDPDLSELYYSSPFGILGERPKRVFGSVFNRGAVWFDSSFLGASTGPPADKHQHHYKEIREDVVLPEHRDQYMQELLEWEENGGWDTDWIEA